MGSREGTFLNSPKLSRNILVQKAFAQHRARRGHSEILLRRRFLTGGSTRPDRRRFTLITITPPPFSALSPISHLTVS